jgi:hypothetical protein
MAGSLTLTFEKFFDRVNHDKLLSLASLRIADGRVITLIRLKAALFHPFLKTCCLINWIRNSNIGAFTS